ncbi:transposase [Dyadobacter sp. CY312]|uniref:transposase n=1 Tax=Dyadobacter sp. CY312 TaxID=2907303 RepID=UPI0038D4F7E5
MPVSRCMYVLLKQRAIGLKRKNLKKFIDEHIRKYAQVRTDGWTGYKGLESEFAKLTCEKSEKKGKNVPQLCRSIMRRAFRVFKFWLRGVHHSVHYLQAYINEYTLQVQPSQNEESGRRAGIFENLMKRMVSKPPHPYKLIIP